MHLVGEKGRKRDRGTLSNVSSSCRPALSETQAEAAGLADADRSRIDRSAWNLRARWPARGRVRMALARMVMELYD
jgi:hypothetical protein